VPLRVNSGDAASADGYRSLRDMWAISRALAREPGDCIFFPTVYSYVPVLSSKPIVAGIHDVIAERLPQHVFDSARARRFWSAKVWLAARQAARVMTVSAHAADGIAAHLGVERSRIAVVGEAPAAVFAPGIDLLPGRRALEAAGIPAEGRFFLYVGGIAPHKNIGALLDAVQTLPADVRLVLAGDVEHDNFLSAYPALKERASALGGGRVVFTGRLEDGAIAALMRLAQALVLPSFDEGFGLPAIEAAACGGAVIATRNSAMPEVLGEAALLIDPHDASSLRTALGRVLDDPVLRASLGERAALRARACTWDAAARRLIAMFEALAA
jgi:glycosyltransferase involved in cell wall biosynthesis